MTYGNGNRDLMRSSQSLLLEMRLQKDPWTIMIYHGNTGTSGCRLNLFIWRATKRRIAVKVELAKRGVQVENQNCSRCNNEEESVNHLLISSLKSRAIWWNVLVWLKLLVQFNSDSCEELLDKIEEFNGSKDWKNLIKAIAMTTLWQIWKSRNDVEFNKKVGSITDLISGIKELSYLWIKERARLKNLVWERWKDFNIRDIIS
ncbi:putative reverse transcriptase zinc-binding domain-containing protein [Helianthus annuus]|nr:putative reverse transcriptase zinc-binding domain-containing protein [Helianthus annuus]